MRLPAFFAGMLVTGAVFGQETWLDCNNFKVGVELKVGFDQQARWLEVRSKDEILQAEEFYITPGKVFGDTGLSTIEINRVSGIFTLTLFARPPSGQGRIADDVKSGECVRTAKPAAGKF